MVINVLENEREFVNASDPVSAVSRRKLKWI